MAGLRGNGNFISPFSTSACKDFSTIGSGHSLTETVFISPFSFGWLKGSFHILISINFRPGKYTTTFF